MGAGLSLVIGSSGTGKTSSLRYLNPKELAIITPNSKPLPIPGLDEQFKGFEKEGKKHRITTNEINQIEGALTYISDKMPHIKVIVVDDLNHFFNARVTSPSFRARNSGGEAFARWNDFGADVTANFILAAEKLRDDLHIFIFAHTDVKEDGKIGMKTSGKLLDQSTDIPSYVTSQLHSIVLEENGKSKYKFLTNTDGVHSAKTPAGMFKDKYIPNDLNKVLKVMTEYAKGNIKAVWED